MTSPSARGSTAAARRPPARRTCPRTAAGSAATTVVPDAPTLANVTAPSIDQPWWTPRFLAGDSVYVSPGQWAGTPDAVTLQWQRCDGSSYDSRTDSAACTDIDGATDSYHRAEVDDVDQRLRVRVTATASDSAPIIVYTEMTQPIGVDVRVYASLQGPVAVGEPATAHAEVVDAEGLATTTSYEWVVSCWNDHANQWQQQTISTGTAPSYTPTAGQLGCGLAVTASVVARSSSGEVFGAATGDAGATIGGPVTQETPATVTGDPIAGQTLTASPGTWSGGRGTFLYDYQWQRCDAEGESCVDVDGATEAVYQTTAADIGHQLIATVAAHIDQGWETDELPGGGVRHHAAAAAVGPVEAGEKPRPAEAPAITGTAVEGATLQVGDGTWSGSEPMSYAYQWQLCSVAGDGCRDIAGATSITYDVPSAIYGRTLRAAVTATNAMGTQTAYSEPTAPVGAGDLPDPETVPSLTVVGPAARGSLVTTDGGTWQNATREQLSYQWLRCGTDGTGCVEIDDAVGVTYTLTDDDAGSRLEIEVTATNAAGEARAISDVSDVIDSAPAATVAEGQVAFVDHGRTQLGVSAPDGTGRATIVTCGQLSLDGCSLYAPRVSPNLGVVAFEARSSAQAEHEGSIYVVNADGTGLRRVVTGGEPVWSPDGSRIVFTQVDPGAGGTALVSVSADGLHTDSPEPAVTAPEDEGGDPGSGGGGGGGASFSARSLTSRPCPSARPTSPRTATSSSSGSRPTRTRSSTSPTAASRQDAAPAGLRREVLPRRPPAVPTRWPRDRVHRAAGRQLGGRLDLGGRHRRQRPAPGLSGRRQALRAAGADGHRGADDAEQLRDLLLADVRLPLVQRPGADLDL